MEIEMYYKPGCPFCMAAEKLFLSKKRNPKKINLLELGKDKLEELSEKSGGWKTAPMIFIDGKFYGGYSDVKKLDDEGKLDNILTTQQ
ncbi:glutaredoxin 3 [Candidatus Pacearchaeota archaeon]|nr:MAG: glutaredoxin 3 [Candidatus Pacearchaeota archaeon]